MTGDMIYTISYYTDSLHLARTLGDIQRQLEALAYLREVYETVGYVHHAVACSIHSLNLYRQQGDRRNEARILLHLGRGYDELGKVDEAIDSCEHSLALAREMGKRQIESRALSALATAYAHLGYARRTLDDGQQALYIAQELEDRQDESVALEALGDGYFYLGELASAETCYRDGLSKTYDLADRYIQSRLLEKIGLTYIDGGAIRESLVFFEQSLQVSGGDALYSKGRSLAHMGDVYTRLGLIGKARKELAEAEGLINDVYLCRGQVLFEHYIGNWLREQGRFEEAHIRYRHAMTLFDNLQDRYGLAKCAFDYARLLRAQGNEREAISIGQSALRIYRERGTEEQVERIQRWREARDG